MSCICFIYRYTAMHLNLRFYRNSTEFYKRKNITEQKFKFNINKKYTRKTLKIVCLCYSQSDLIEKRLNAFQFGSFFHYYNNYSGKTERANDPKFCT
jgi:hypothetical protein